MKVLVAVVLLGIVLVESKTFDRCELAKLLLNKYKFPKDQIATWVCIAYQESRYQTTAVNQQTWDYGVFQISSIYWCSKNGEKKACGITCQSLLDDDITNDVKCVRQIFDETQRLKGNGFMAWTTYQFCKDPKSYAAGCF